MTIPGIGLGFRLGFGKYNAALLALTLGVLAAPCALAEPETSQLRVIRADHPEPPLRRVIQAEPGTSPPPGYHPEQRIRLGLTIGGGVTCAFGLAMIAIGASSNDYASGVQGNAAESTVNYSGLYYVLGGINLAVGILLLEPSATQDREWHKPWHREPVWGPGCRTRKASLSAIESMV